MEGNIIKNRGFLKVVFVGTVLVTLMTASDTLYINVDSSTINWTGRKITGKHSGTLNLSKGWVVIEGDSIIRGKFIFDMISINNTDIESPE